MAKGKGKKGGKKKGKGKVEKPEGALTEVDKTFYELTITDLNRKLARLRSTNTELEEKNETLNEKLTKLDEDRNDVIVYLKRILQERTEEINELQVGITKLQESLEQDKEECTTKTEQMENDYKQMHEQLTSEIKLLEGKLNALEEFRVQREDLMKKFEAQEDQMEEQEQKHKRAIYEIERKFIIAKDKLKKEMEARLLQLSTEFQDATEIRIAATTHRVIRENIAINNELDEMLNVHKRLYSENQDMKQRDKTLRQQAQLHCIEKNKALGKARVQGKVIEQLTGEHESMKKKLEHFKNIESDMHVAREELYKAHLKVQSLENKIRVLEQNFHAAKCTITSLETNSSYYLAEATRLEAVLLEAVGAIKEAAKIQRAQRITDKATLATKRENLLNQLFKLMITAKDTKIKKPSLSSVSSVESIYKKGDLGFVPPESKVIRPTLRAIRTLQSQTGSSLGEGSGDEGAKAQTGTSIGQDDGKIYQEESKEEENSQPSVVFFDDKESTEEEEPLPMPEEVEEIGEIDPLSVTQMMSSVGRLPVTKSTSRTGSKPAIE
ncbi:cilia- and flagella-associated protein 157 [Coccinella septempunctata]|uniref:cilia- and flagella-associated protein 157 n=1 Tax=Coccinella septempunctata TaxID=41139 RepID=UPI001D08C41A|nr:cilia- and flagella-associated protein 157 [Coccinella septempunctata]